MIFTWDLFFKYLNSENELKFVVFNYCVLSLVPVKTSSLSNHYPEFVGILALIFTYVVIIIINSLRKIRKGKIRLNI